MASDRLRQLAVQWGGLALVAQIWVALSFVQNVPREWQIGHPRLDSPRVIADRISQLKPALFKFPWSALYLGSFLLLILIVTVTLWIVGMRQAMAPERDDHAS
jgi:hypothetical protein